MMDQLNRSNRHRAEVIEIYDNGLRAAVRFTSGRIEVVLRPSPPSGVIDFFIGQKGMADFTRTIGGWIWTFEPFKNRKSSEIK